MSSRRGPYLRHQSQKRKKQERGPYYKKYLSTGGKMAPRTSAWRAKKSAASTGTSAEHDHGGTGDIGNTRDTMAGASEELDESPFHTSEDHQDDCQFNEEIKEASSVEDESSSKDKDKRESNSDEIDGAVEYSDIAASDGKEDEQCPLEGSSDLLKEDVGSPEELEPVDAEECSTSGSEDEMEELKTGGSDERPLYAGSRLTVILSAILITTFVTRHGLSGECFQDLLTLVELHCLSDNLCTTSYRAFKKMFSNGANGQIQKHFYCQKCSQYLGVTRLDGILEAQTCRSCGTCVSDEHFFVVNPLEDALKSAFSRNEFVEKLMYRTERKKKNEQNIEDLMDGEVYRQVFDEHGYFYGTPEERRSCEIHLSFQMNTDGVATFKSNKTTVWPVYLVVNEMHPKQRFSRSERLLLGVWYGGTKPFFRTFMKPFAEALTNLYIEGVKVTNQVYGEKVIRGVLLSAVLDMPARSMFQEFTQFNGKMGCSFCKTPGDILKTDGGGHARIYPYNRESQSGHHDLRTHEETKESADEAQRSGITVNGVKGHSWFLFVPEFNIIECVAADYMHGLVLGVVKMLTSLWFDSSHHKEEFNLSKKIDEIDRRMSKIKPPHQISRMPRSIGSHIKFWKASEFRSFLLFYAIPCLFGILPEEYFQHFLLLNEASFILISNSISDQCLQKAGKLLKHFCLRIEALYGKRYQTANVHGLLHYVHKVYALGPLWANSCFFYEDFNGDLSFLFHGTRNIAAQMISTVCLQQIIPKFVNSLVRGSPVHEFYLRLTKPGQPGKIVENIGNGYFIVGTLKALTADPNLTLVRGWKVCKLYRFLRVKMNGVIVSCRMYRPGIKRNSSVISFSEGNSISYGHIEYFLKCYTECPNEVFCTERCICNVASYFVVVSKLLCSTATLTKDSFTGASNPNVIMVKKESVKTCVIPISNISHLCVWMDVGLDDAFIAHFPNNVEKD